MEKLPGSRKMQLIFPHGNPFTAIGTDVNIFAAGHKLFAKLFIIIIVPYFFKGLHFKIAQTGERHLYQNSRAQQGHPR